MFKQVGNVFTYIGIVLLFVTFFITQSEKTYSDVPERNQVKYVILVTDVADRANSTSLDTTTIEFSDRNQADIAYSKIAGSKFETTSVYATASRTVTKLY